MKNNNLGSVRQIGCTNEQIAFFGNGEALNHNYYFTETAGLEVGEVKTGPTTFRCRLTQQKLKGLLARFTGRKLPHLYACGTMNK